MLPPYQRFEAWKAAHKLALEIYRITDDWPPSERYQLTSQIRRAALSVAASIAEGAGNKGAREFRRYLDIARGSLCELSYLLLFSKDRGMLNMETFDSVEELRNRAGKITWGLYVSLAMAQTPHYPPPDRLTACRLPPFPPLWPLPILPRQPRTGFRD